VRETDRRMPLVWAGRREQDYFAQYFGCAVEGIEVAGVFDVPRLMLQPIRYVLSLMSAQSTSTSTCTASMPKSENVLSLTSFFAQNFSA